MGATNKARRQRMAREAQAPPVRPLPDFPGQRDPVDRPQTTPVPPAPGIINPLVGRAYSRPGKLLPESDEELAAGLREAGQEISKKVKNMPTTLLGVKTLPSLQEGGESLATLAFKMFGHKPRPMPAREDVGRTLERSLQMQKLPGTPRWAAAKHRTATRRKERGKKKK